MRDMDASILIAVRALSERASGQFDSKLAATRRRALALGAGAGAGALAAPLAQAQRAPAAAPLAGLAARINTEAPDVQSVAVVQRGALVLDFYRAGLAPGSLQDVQSVTKSVLSLLFGCALADGHVRGTHELVAMHLPELLRLGGDARLQRLRFAHLLTMTAGWPGSETARRDRDDDLAWLARRPFVAEPGARFAYDNGAANLLALALARAVRQPLDDYARDRLLAPLGIARAGWRRGAHGHALGALGLSLATRDMARLGELVLAAGRWQGRALLPTDYLQQATTRRHAGGAPVFAPYGYLWWVSADAAARGAVMASGYGGQWIYVDPARQAVLALTSRRTPESAARGQALALIRRTLLPALR
jgi:CubicO group peptidase (beta-lactamase class C family)